MDLDPSLWLSRVRAIPGIALKCRPTYESSADLLSLTRAYLLRWTDRAGELTITTEAFQVRVEDKEGFAVTIAHDNVAVTFSYKATLLETSPNGPELSHAGFQFSAPIRPVREILQDCEKRLLELMSDLQKVRPREISRIGIVASGVFDPKNPVPGFELFLNHISKPWVIDGALGLDVMAEGKVALSIDIQKNNDFTDRCIHTLEWKKDTEDSSRQTMHFKLDWQHWMSKGRKYTQSQLTELINSADKQSFDYFGRFGKGDLSYD